MQNDPSQLAQTTMSAGNHLSEPLSRGQAFKARALLVFMLSALIALAGYVLYARGAFETTQTLVLITDDSEGVAVGMDMTFAGFPLGRVSRVELAPDGMARIVIDIPKKNSQWLRQSSVFTVERNMIGAVRIRAYSGIMEDPVLEDGAERQLLRGDAFGEFQKLALPMQQLLEKLNQIAADTGKATKDLDLLRDDIEANLRKIDTMTDTLGKKWPFAKNPEMKLP
jgi:phospholipid/cholesterol/gamma-HCH transport system substrate-binding protein